MAWVLHEHTRPWRTLRWKPSGPGDLLMLGFSCVNIAVLVTKTPRFPLEDWGIEQIQYLVCRLYTTKKGQGVVVTSARQVIFCCVWPIHQILSVVLYRCEYYGFYLLKPPKRFYTMQSFLVIFMVPLSISTWRVTPEVVEKGPVGC